MPSWTPVKTWDAEILTSSDLNTYVRDDLEYLKAQADLAVLSGVIVNRNGATQSIPDSTNTPISFTNEVLDQGGWITVTSTTATVPASAIPAGYTTVLLQTWFIVTFAANATGVRRARLTKNGSSEYSIAYSAASADTTDLVASWPVTAVAGDTFQLEVYQTSTGSLNATAGAMSLVVLKPIS